MKTSSNPARTGRPRVCPLFALLCIALASLFAPPLQARDITAKWDTRYTGANYLQRLEFAQAESVNLTLNLSGNVPAALTLEGTTITWQVWDWDLSNQWATATGAIVDGDTITATLTQQEANMPPATYRAYLVAVNLDAGTRDVVAAQALVVHPSSASASIDPAVPLPTADASLQDNITAEAAARAAADVTLQNNITAETTARTAADATLQTSIDNIELSGTGYTDAEMDTLLAAKATTTDLTTETTARTAGDAALQTSIDNLDLSGDGYTDTEIDALLAAKAADADLTTEETTRANADTALDGRVTTLEGTTGGGTPGLEIKTNAALDNYYQLADTGQALHNPAVAHAVDLSYWDRTTDSGTQGEGSFSVGVNALASGTGGAMAIGRHALASGSGAMALGGYESVAIGNSSLAAQGSVVSGGSACGLLGSTVSGLYSFGAGKGAVVSGKYAAIVAGGYSSGGTCTASGDHSLIMGSKTATASASHAAVIASLSSQARGAHAIVAGSTSSYAEGAHCLTLGSDTSYAGQYGQTYAYALALCAESTTVRGTHSVAIGDDIAVASDEAMVISLGPSACTDAGEGTIKLDTDNGVYVSGGPLVLPAVIAPTNYPPEGCMYLWFDATTDALTWRRTVDSTGSTGTLVP